MNRSTLEKALELIKELPTSSKVGILATLGTSGTLIAARHTATGTWKVYQEISAYRWFWEDHTIIGLVRLRELRMWESPAGMNPAPDMLSVGTPRHQKRSGRYSSKPLMDPNLTLARPAEIERAPPFIHVVLGDSAAQGVRCEDVRDSHVALLASYLCHATKRRATVLNLPISGAISPTITDTKLPRLLTLGVKPDSITLDTGGNDTFADDAGTPVELFEKNLEIIRRCLPVSTLIAEVSAVTPPPRDRYAMKLNEALKAAVKGSSYTVAPARKFGEAPSQRILSIRIEDGFHPNMDSYHGTALEFARASETLLKGRDLWQGATDDLYS